MSDTIKVILALSVVYGAVFIIIGFIFGGDYKDFFLNIGTELFGIFITVFAIEYIYRREEKKVAQQEEKRRLISILVTGSRQSVEEALDKLRYKEWLSDGSIAEEFFDHRDFSGLDFIGAKFVDCFFDGVTFDEAYLQFSTFERVCFAENTSFKNTEMYSINLEGLSFPEGIVTYEMLQNYMLSKAKSLRHATMPDGKHYDGRYRLPGDLEYSRKRGIQWDLKSHTQLGVAEKMAAFYNVSLEEYKAGQEWAENNLKG